jgi:hypothetical protein
MENTCRPYAAVVLVAAAPVAFPEEVRSVDESHISGGNRCSCKIRPASLVWLRAQLCVTLVNGSEIFPLRLVPQSTLLKIVFESGYILMCLDGPSSGYI